MAVEQRVADVMSAPVMSVTPESALQDAVRLISEHHISGLPVVDGDGRLVGEVSEQDLMIRESGFDAGPYVMLLDSVIYLRNPLAWDKQVHQVLGTHVSDLMGQHPHSCSPDLGLPQAARLLHESGTQRLFVVDGERRPIGVITRGDVVRALAKAAD
ncbi:CBS domain-containing protein [Synechococcus sp. RSCCF101]|uniref:CBS domain-containing protein n=1 Tax=Synechococcus sp. RSCCF101 TaxID=2511069 RepID=UPI0012470733|nr:CBS domain-containing protein [Synechococcus sp. RSCCF101]QEY31661.1 CBS domain-containing protein [Synechococcus sp. RSCCF101]